MFGRRRSQPLLVTTEVTTRVKRTTPPVGPAIPLGAARGERDAGPGEDTARVIRHSALVIGFLAAGAHPGLLTDGVWAALTDPDACGVPAAGGPDDFAATWCADAVRRRRLITHLAVARPASDPTAAGIRQAVAGWLRASGYAAAPDVLHGAP
jgi:hypothetical protein